MIKLMDLLNEAKVHRLQIFTPGTGGPEKYNMVFNPRKVPTGKLKIGIMMACVNKPIGGFWTSGYRKSIKASDWSEWKRMKQPEWRTGFGAVFQVVGNPKLAVVNNNKDYEKLLKKYRNDLTDICGTSGPYYLNWHALAKDYDGFRLTFKGSRDFIPGVHEWDVESTVWFNMNKLEFLGTTKV
tara:strand:+ start:2008 stop:2556 length:549 start_codon:yes stop_codon:yes gene_type:complete